MLTDKIYDLLKKGYENRITTEEIMEKTGLTRREVCRHIELARSDGDVILSCASGGYWLPDEDNPEELEKELGAFIHFLNAKNTFYTVKSAVEMLERIKARNQIGLEEKYEQKAPLDK